MTPFLIGGGAPVARICSETLRIDAHGQDALRTRARPGLMMAEPHVTALLPLCPPAPKSGSTAPAPASPTVASGPS